MKVGTDGILLGAWTDVSKCNHILDVGTGTGVIAIMMAQRCTNATVHAIEVESNAFDQALANINNCPWSDRIMVLNGMVQNFIPKVKYDLIISNPPFFRNSLKAPIANRTIARHTDNLPFEDLIHFSVKNLSLQGKLSIILPVSEFRDFTNLAANHGLYLIRECLIKPVPYKTAKRVTMEFSLTSQNVTREQLTIESGQRHDYTPEYKKLTKEFYTIF